MEPLLQGGTFEHLNTLIEPSYSLKRALKEPLLQGGTFEHFNTLIEP
jgi:hypothetical protein